MSRVGKDAYSYDGYGRSLRGGLSHTEKCNADRIVDKRRRRAAKREAKEATG